MLTEELKKKVADFVEMEQRLCSTQLMTAEYVARCMQISLKTSLKSNAGYLSAQVGLMPAV